MIPASAAFTTANEEQAKTPVNLIEIDGYEYAFTNQVVSFDPLPADQQAQVLDGPFTSESGWGVGAYFYQPTRTLYWIGYHPDSGAITLYALRNGEVTYKELEDISGSLSFAAELKNYQLYFDGNFFYLNTSSIYDNGAVQQFNFDGTHNSSYISAGGIGAPGPFSSFGANAVASGTINGAYRVVVCDAHGRTSLMSVDPLSEEKSCTVVGGGPGTCQPIIDKNGETWIVRTTTITHIDWEPTVPVQTTYALGTFVGLACYIPADNTVLALGTALYKFSLSSLTVVGTASITGTTYSMSTQVGADGMVVVGVNKVNPITLAFQTTLDISDFSLPIAVTLTGAFGRPYDSVADEFYVQDNDGTVWGLRAAAGPGSTIRPWLMEGGGVDEFGASINDLDGAADVGELAFNVQDQDGLLTADFPDFTFEGKTMRYKTGILGMDREDFITLFTGIIDNVANTANCAGYTFNCLDNMRWLDALVFTEGDLSSLPISEENPRTLNGHPIDMLISIIEDELGKRREDYDYAKLIRYRDEVYAGTQMLFTITSAPQARDFIANEIMKPLGGYIWCNGAGKLAFNFFLPLADAIEAVMDIDENIITAIPVPIQADMVNVVQFKFDKSEDKFLSNTVNVFADSELLYGLFDPQVIESAGMQSALQAFFLAGQTSRGIFARYGLKNLKIEDLPVFWNAVQLEPGDLINLTHSAVPDRKNGVIGITDWFMMVLDRGYDPTECLVKLTLIDASALLRFGQFKIAPDDTAAWTAATTPQKLRYLFLSDNDGLMSDDAVGNTLG